MEEVAVDALRAELDRLGLIEVENRLTQNVYRHGKRALVEQWISEKKAEIEVRLGTGVLEQMRRQTDVARTAAAAATRSMYITMAAAGVSLVAAIYAAIVR